MKYRCLIEASFADALVHLAVIGRNPAPPAPGAVVDPSGESSTAATSGSDTAASAGAGKGASAVSASGGGATAATGAAAGEIKQGYMSKAICQK